MGEGEAASGRKRTKDEIIYTAYARYGCMLKEVAGHLGVHYAAVSRLIKSRFSLQCGKPQDVVVRSLA